MAVEAIQKNNTNNSRKMSVASSATIGALAGYTLKWALPVTSLEKDEKYTLGLEKIRQVAKQARADEKLAISKSKGAGVDTFNKLDKNGLLNRDEINKLKGAKKTQVEELYSRLGKAAIRAKTDGRKALNATTKNLRPVSAFMLAGVAVASGIAFIHNLFHQIDECAEDE